MRLRLNAAVGTFEQMLVDLNIIAVATDGFTPFKLIFGIVLAALLGLVILG